MGCNSGCHHTFMQRCHNYISLGGKHKELLFDNFACGLCWYFSLKNGVAFEMGAPLMWILLRH